MSVTRKIFIAVPIAFLGAMVLGAAAVWAAPGPSPAPADGVAGIFVSKLAGILHLSTGQTTDDLKQAELQTIDQMLADGKITQAQANAMKQSVESGGGLGFFGPHFGPGRDFGGGALMMTLRNAEFGAVASALHLSVSDLQSQLRSGKTLSELEQSKGVSDSALQADVKAAAKKVLDAAVKAGQITQAQENGLLMRPFFGRFGFGFGPPRGGFGRFGPAPGSGLPPAGSA